MSPLSFIILIGIASVGGEEDFVIKPFRKTPGLYYEQLGDLQTIHTQWELLIYWNITSIQQSLELVRMHMSDLNARCLQLQNNKVCAQLLSTSKIMFDQITSQDLVINDLLGIERYHRIKRWAPFGFIGSFSKTLFGTLNEQDAERYDRDINNLRQKQNNFHNLIRKQQTILEVQVDSLKKLQTYFEGLKDNIGAIEKEIRIINRNITANTIDIRLTNAFQLFDNIWQLYKLEQDKLLEILVAAIQGKVHPLLLSLDDLQEELVRISNQMSHSVKLPFQKDSRSLYRIIDIKIYYYEGKLNFLLQIPLVSDNIYKIHKISIVPRLLNNSYVAFIMPPEDHIAIDFKNQIYFTVTYQELKECGTSLGKKHFVCESNKPGIKFEHGNCVTQLLVKGQVDDWQHCNMRLTKIEDQMFVTLANPFSWIYVFPKRKPVTIVCNDHKQIAYLNSTGLITLAPGCTMISDHIVITTKQITNSTSVGSDQYSFSNITEILLDIPEIDEGNVFTLPRNLESFDSIFDSDDLNKVSSDLGDLRRDVDKPLLDVGSYSTETISLATGIPSGLLLVVIVIIVWLVLRKRKMPYNVVEMRKI